MLGCRRMGSVEWIVTSETRIGGERRLACLAAAANAPKLNERRSEFIWISITINTFILWYGEIAVYNKFTKTTTK